MIIRTYVRLVNRFSFISGLYRTITAVKILSYKLCKCIFLKKDCF
nr:MAG TPA: hypothetical protein [Caudoviricetes sp.]